MRPSRSGPKVTAQGRHARHAGGATASPLEARRAARALERAAGRHGFRGTAPGGSAATSISGIPLWKEVLRVRPGLTDPVTAPVPGRGVPDGGRRGRSASATTARRCSRRSSAGYVEYLRNRSWRSDLRVLGQTLVAILRPGRVDLQAVGPIRAPARVDKSLKAWLFLRYFCASRDKLISLPSGAGKNECRGAAAFIHPHLSSVPGRQPAKDERAAP